MTNFSQKLPAQPDYYPALGYRASAISNTAIDAPKSPYRWKDLPCCVICFIDIKNLQVKITFAKEIIQVTFCKILLFENKSYFTVVFELVFCQTRDHVPAHIPNKQTNCVIIRNVKSENRPISTVFDSLVRENY